jgi:hypothetical protein
MPRLSFTLRDVFWLTLVVGMGMGWWVDHQHWSAVVQWGTDERNRSIAVYLSQLDALSSQLAACQSKETEASSESSANQP